MLRRRLLACPGEACLNVGEIGSALCGRTHEIGVTRLPDLPARRVTAATNQVLLNPGEREVVDTMLDPARVERERSFVSCRIRRLIVDVDVGHGHPADATCWLVRLGSGKPTRQ